MLEIPEAYVLAAQLNQTVSGKRIREVIANGIPHKMAFYYEDPQAYPDLLCGEQIDKAVACGGLVEIRAGKKIILIGDGMELRYHETAAQRPPKHQLLLEFSDGSALSAKVQMYGGIWCFPEGQVRSPSSASRVWATGCCRTFSGRSKSNPGARCRP